MWNENVVSPGEANHKKDASLKGLEVWGGIECTINRVGDVFHNQLSRSGHLSRIEDLDRIADLGIKKIRYPLLWEAIAPKSLNSIDWSWADKRMKRLQELGIDVIVGLVHHGSGPQYTSLIDPQFPELLAKYARLVAMRYPWVEAYTPINEPLTTARFAALYGWWFPHARDQLTFCRVLLNQLRGIVFAMRAIRQVNPSAQLVQTEDLGEIKASPRLRYQADFENERRWLTFDLLCGRGDKEHPLADYFKEVGITQREFSIFNEEPCPPDVFGINHYVTSNRYLDECIEKYPVERWGNNGIDTYVDVEAVRAQPEDIATPADLLWQVWSRYQSPIAITEAHLACTREEQIRWFVGIWNAASALRESGVPLVAVTAWSLFGAYDWNSLLTQNTGYYEPGAFDLRAEKPRPTALAEIVRNLACTGQVNFPLQYLPGWWNRDLRFLQHINDRTGDAFDVVQQVYSVYPRFRKSCPPLLITGATGTLGRAFARMCSLRGIPYNILTRAELDISNVASVQNAVREFKPWGIINAAGYVRVDDAEKEKERCFRENAVGAKILADVCADSNLQLLTFSSDLVFDGDKIDPYVESDLPRPLNIYGKSKLAAEREVIATHPKALTVRTSAFFDRWDVHNFVIKTYHFLREGKEVKAVSDVIVSPTYVPHLVNAALDLLMDQEYGIWHLANDGQISWAELAREVACRTALNQNLIMHVSQNCSGSQALLPRNSSLASERGQIMPSLDKALDEFFDLLA